MDSLTTSAGAPFSPSNKVRGIGFSRDKMLQVRVFSYADAYRYRLGTHYEALPVNARRRLVHNCHKDGTMRFFRNDGGNPESYYEPDSFAGPKQDPAFAETPLRIGGDAARYDHRNGNDDFSQSRSASLMRNKNSVSIRTSPLQERRTRGNRRTAGCTLRTDWTRSTEMACGRLWPHMARRSGQAAELYGERHWWS